MGSNLKQYNLEIVDVRDELSHGMDILHNSGGISSDSVLNQLDHFHTSTGFPPCVGHDCFQGKFKEDLQNIILLIRKNFHINPSYLIKKLKMFTKSTGESYIYINKKTGKISGSMTQVKNTILVLPLLFLGTAGIGTQIHQFCLILTDLTRMILARNYCSDSLNELRKLIDNYMFSKRQNFPNKSFTPKDHYISHYPDLIKFYGPLRFLWTLDFEQFHQQFKFIQSRTKNFKNPIKTLAINHQLNQLASDRSNNCKIEALYTELAISSDKGFIFKAKKVKVFGTQFKIGDKILFSKNASNLEILTITSILVDKLYENAQFRGDINVFNFDSKLGLFEQQHSNILPNLNIDTNNLILFKVLYVHRHFSKNYICLTEFVN
jgi:hypothetical protein